MADMRKFLTQPSGCHSFHFRVHPLKAGGIEQRRLSSTIETVGFQPANSEIGAEK
ncbi:hypothetical protein ACFOUO_09835 [Salinithrix halophila]|uniref:Uncharacterized protein n=1 Tax=Salinithrix halophila TaxID=1485204 RepID=A0ABV8JFI3_9BACL